MSLAPKEAMPRRRLWLDLEELIESAWKDGKLKWSNDEFAEAMFSLFPEQYEAGPQQQVLFRESRDEVDADHFAMLREQAARKRSRGG